MAKKYDDILRDPTIIKKELRKNNIDLSGLNGQEQKNFIISCHYVFSAYEGRGIGNNLNSMARVFEEIDKRKPFCFVPVASAICDKEGIKPFINSQAFNDIKSKNLRASLKSKYAQALRKSKDLCPSFEVSKHLGRLFPEIQPTLDWFYQH